MKCTVLFLTFILLSSYYHSKMHIFYKYFVYVVIACCLLYFLTATQETWLGNFPGKTCACKQCMNNDSWFMQHYASRVPKLLNRRNSNLSKSTLDWWLMIQPYHRKKFHDIVQPLFSLFPDKEHYSDAGPKRCRICAVVGNSDNLIGSNYGELIDAHDFIFRRMKLKVRVIYMTGWVFLLLIFCRVEFRYHWDDFFKYSTPKLCGCMSCILEPKEDPWFRERFNSRVPKFLNRTNSNLSTITHNWWMKLQPSRTVNLSDIVKPLFSLFHNEEPYSDFSPKRCRTCAVVGNSANLLRSHYGAIIDAHDFVFRMNRAPTKGYERDTGAKTTHRVMYPESAVDLDHSTHLLMLPFKVLDLQWLISVFTTKNITRTYMAVKRTIKADQGKVMIINPEFMRYVYENWLNKEGKYPSTGFITLMFALHICDQVNVFGFGATGNGRWYHYFDNWHHPYINSGVHRGGVEYETLLKLQEKGKIRMYKGW